MRPSAASSHCSGMTRAGCPMRNSRSPSRLNIQGGGVADWHVFHGSGQPHDWTMPPPPPWRAFNGGPVMAMPNEDWWRRRPVDLERAKAYQADPSELEAFNVALYLRRPLLVTGPPGTGKSTLAYAASYELGLGP